MNNAVEEERRMRESMEQKMEQMMKVRVNNTSLIEKTKMG